MQSDSDLVEAVRDYIQTYPKDGAYGVVRYFGARGIPEEKILYILREIYG